MQSTSGLMTLSVLRVYSEASLYEVGRSATHNITDVYMRNSGFSDTRPKWTLRISTSRLAEMWRDLLLMMIAGTLVPPS